MAPFPLGDRHHLVGGHEQELGLRIDELLDEPRAGDPVHLDLLGIEIVERGFVEDTLDLTRATINSNKVFGIHRG